MSDAAAHADRNPYGYPEPIWSRFDSPQRAGRFGPRTSGLVEGRAGTPAARSVLELQLQFQGGRVVDARFRAYGCPSSIAVGDWIAAWAIGQDRTGLSRLNARQLREALEIPEDRAHCALMGEDAMKALLARLDEITT